MEIKCPKCRYKFEETIAPGINEKACVCPRCGTPFIYKAEATDSGAHTSDNVAAPQNSMQHNGTCDTQAQATEAHTYTQHDGDAARQPNGNDGGNSLRGNSDGQQGADTYADLQRQLKTKDQLKKKAQKNAARWRNLRRTLFIVAAILFVVFTLINHFMQKSYSSPEEKDDATTFVETNVDNSKTVEEESKIIDDNDRWIEGSWYDDTGLEFTFSIRGNQISITDGQDIAVNGTYTIKGNKLTFGEYTFTLDKKKHCIWFDGIKFTESHFY